MQTLALHSSKTANINFGGGGGHLAFACMRVCVRERTREDGGRAGGFPEAVLVCGVRAHENSTRSSADTYCI